MQIHIINADLCATSVQHKLQPECVPLTLVTWRRQLGDMVDSTSKWMWNTDLTHFLYLDHGRDPAYHNLLQLLAFQVQSVTNRRPERHNTLSLRLLGTTRCPIGFEEGPPACCKLHEIENTTPRLEYDEIINPADPWEP